MESCFLWGQRFSSSGFCSPGDESHSNVNGLGLLDPQQEGGFVWRTLYHNEQLQVLASFSAKWVIMLAGVRQKLSGICWSPPPPPPPDPRHRVGLGQAPSTWNLHV